MSLAEKVEQFFTEEHHFKNAVAILRELALKTNLEETYKWMFPTYTLAGNNVLAICKFNKHFGIWFFKGVFLSDPLKVLENAQEGKTQAMRHWKFFALEEVNERETLRYMNEAIANEKAGLKLIAKKKTAAKKQVPALLKEALSTHAIAQMAFEKLSPYNQMEYCEYIVKAKKENTKISRLEKILPMIAAGKGLKDMYRKQ